MFYVSFVGYVFLGFNITLLISIIFQLSLNFLYVNFLFVIVVSAVNTILTSVFDNLEYIEPGLPTSTECG